MLGRRFETCSENAEYGHHLLFRPSVYLQMLSQPHDECANTMGAPVSAEHQLIEVKSGALTIVQWSKLFVFTSSNAAARVRSD